ncbi:MAG: hypothetical protein JRJ23_05920, partial [Deltaproteobacteria bacterium]|nr:hypothetical protein [Deltaproteobacteria bacterium]
MKVKYIPNLFDRADRKEFEVEEYEKQTVEELLESLLPEVPAKEVVPIVHGRAVGWNYVPAINEHEVIYVQDLKDGQRMLKYSGLVVGAGLIVAGFFTGGATTPYGIALVAGYAVSAAAAKLTEIPKQKGFENSQTYSWNGINNTIGEGSVVPVVYGHHEVGGLVIEAWSEGDVVRGTSWYYDSSFIDKEYTLRALIAFGEGPICAVNENSIKLNKQSIDNYGKDCNSFTTLGEIDQEILDTDFSSVKRQYSLQDNFELVDNTQGIAAGSADGFTYECYDKCDRVYINFIFPHGCHDGDDIRTIKLEAAYQSLSSDPDNDPWAEPKSEGDDYGANLWLKVKNKSAFQIDHRIILPGYDNWRIKVWREDSPYTEGVNDVFVTHLVEVTSSVLNYPATALLGVEVVATDKLYGRLPTITAEIWGRRLDDVRGYGAGLAEQITEYTFA